MMDNNLRSLESLFSSTLRNSEGDDIRVNSIFIPKIQRSYAQGRRSEREVRNAFLDQLFSLLKSGKSRELSFVYGSLDMHGADDSRLELLDGQQRTTTLWLLYWYVFTRENLPLPAWMTNGHHALFYDTRDTSSEFIKRLATERFTFPVSGVLPSEEIQKARWYSGELHVDPSVDSMIRMIDDMHGKYQEILNGSGTPANSVETAQPPKSSDVIDSADSTNKSLHLARNLKNIKFYVQLLENFGLTEDLYVKMNARGLQLKPFENFKADMVEWTKRNTDSAFYDSITKLFDRQWTDYFYATVPDDKNLTDPVKIVGYKDNEFNARFFRFFYRYFAWRRAIDSEAVPNPRNFNGRKDPLMTFFAMRSEEEQSERYLGFSCYESMLAGDPTHCDADLHTIARVLSKIVRLGSRLGEICSPPWQSEKAFDPFVRKLEQRPFAILGGLFAYLELADSDIDSEEGIANLKRWMRIVNNIAENTDIDNIGVMAAVMRQFYFMAKLNEISEDVYAAVSICPITGNTSRSMKEEIFKARYIAVDSRWEESFLSAESHPLFRGMVLFFIPEDVADGLTLDQFSRRLGMAKQIFAANGIAAEFRDESLLLRGIVAQKAQSPDFWEAIKEMPLVQFDGADRSLRNLLADDDDTRALLRELSAKQSIEEVKQTLNGLIASPYTTITNTDSQWAPYLRNAYERLIRDLKLYQWIDSEFEQSRKRIVKVAWIPGGFKGQIMAGVPRAWYAKINIDTNRAHIIRRLIEEEGFSFKDSNQNDFFNRFDDAFGNDVTLERTEPNDYKKVALFTRKPELRIYRIRKDDEISDDTQPTATVAPCDAAYPWIKVSEALHTT